MPDLTSCLYVNLKENEEQPKNHRKILLLNEEPHFTIISPLSLLEKKLKILPKVFVK